MLKQKHPKVSSSLSNMKFCYAFNDSKLTFWGVLELQWEIN